MHYSLLRCFFVALLLTINFTSNAQSLISKSSAEQKFRPDESIIDKVTTPDNRTYVMRWKLSTVTIDYFDASLTLVKSAKFELPRYTALWPLPIRLLATESRLVIIAVTERGDDVHDLLALSVNDKTLEPAKNFVHLGSPPHYLGSRDYQFAVSPNGKFLAVTFFSMEDNESAIPSHYPGTYDLITLNADLGMVTIAKMEEYEGNWRRTITGITLANDGQLLASVKIQSATISAFENFWSGTATTTWSEGWLFPYNPYPTEAETRKRLKAVNTRFAIFTYETGSTSPRITKINLPGKKLVTLSVVHNEDGTFQLSGLYSDKGAEVVADTQVVKTKKVDSTIVMRFRQTVNGLFVVERTALDSVITISAPIRLTEPIAFDEVEMTRYSGSRTTFYTIVAQIVIRDLLPSAEGGWITVAEVIGERASAGQGNGFDHAINPFADNAYVMQVAKTDTVCRPSVIVKHQILRYESLRLVSVVTMMESGKPVVYYNNFTYEDRDYFSASSVYGSARNMTRATPGNGMPTTGVTDPVLKDFWILSPNALRSESLCKIQVVTNRKSYKLVQFN